MSSSHVSVACFKITRYYEEECCQDVADGQGTTWRLSLHVSDDDTDDLVVRGGFRVAPKEETRASALFSSLSIHKFVDAKVSLVVRNRSGHVGYEHTIPMTSYKCRRKNDDNNVVEFDFAKLSVLKELLVDNALIIDAIIQYNQWRLHVPKNPFRENMLKLLDSEEDKDVFFKVEGRIMSAHKLILKANSSVLATLCIGESSKESPIHIKDTKQEVLRYVLLFLYGGDAPGNAHMIKYGREIIDICDKYDVVGLKIATETALVHARVINVDNVAEWIQYADAKTCPLLKEYALSYFMARSSDVLKTEAYKRMKQSPSLLEELIMAALPTLDEDERFGGKKEQSVNEMRRELSRLRLDVDGSKEMLVARLDAAKGEEEE